MGRTLNEVEKRAKRADELTDEYISIMKAGIERFDKAIAELVKERNDILDFMADGISKVNKEMMEL